MKLLNMIRNWKFVPCINNRIRNTVLISAVLLILVGLIFTVNDPNIDLNYTDLIENFQGTKDRLNLATLEIDESKYGIYSKLFRYLADAAPNFEPLSDKFIPDNPKVRKFLHDGVHFNDKFLSSLVRLNNYDKLSLFNSYQKFLDGMNALEMDVFGNEMHSKIEGRGIVMVGGAKFSWLALLNIHQLRKTGSELPIEVYIPTKSEYDRDFCDIVLPELYARCVLGFNMFPVKKLQKYFHLNKFEHKMMAILSSSFEDVLLLDADNLVTVDPTSLFDWKTYKDNQLILWPDCWVRSTNPFLFELFQIDINYSDVQSDDYDVHNLPGSIPNPSTESGMLLVNKRTQVQTLLLSLYLNIYGSDYFYPLITQGGAGQGDKDTYIIAAYALEKPVYQVKQSVRFLGTFTDGDFHSSGLGQCNPMNEEEANDAANNLISDCNDYMFVHLSFPKYYPNEISGHLLETHGKQSAQFDDLHVGYDFELQIWEIMAQLLCSNFEKNSIEPDNQASSLLDPKHRLTGMGLSYIKDMNINMHCDTGILPHLEYLRGRLVEND